MKFRFPVVIIDEDFRSENSSGLGIRVLAKAIEAEGFTRQKTRSGYIINGLSISPASEEAQDVFPDFLSNTI